MRQTERKKRRWRRDDISPRKGGSLPSTEMCCEHIFGYSASSAYEKGGGQREEVLFSLLSEELRDRGEGVGKKPRGGAECRN